MRAGTRLAGLFGSALAGVLLSAVPAAAHGVGGLQPTNYRTDVHGILPPVAGLSVRVVDLGSRLELRNTSASPVVVLGYDGEPYLRVSRDGVFENTRSPAVFLNRQTVPTSAPPPSYDASAPPVWRRVSTGDLARWHDHRAHWMGGVDPPQVARAPGRPHVVIPSWRVPLRRGDEQLAIAGDVRWVPGPTPWPWAMLALVLFAGVLAGALTRRWAAALAAALATVLVTEVVHVAGAWTATTVGAPTELGAAIYSIVAIALGVAALGWTARRGAAAAAPGLLVAGLAFFIAGGLTDVTALFKSQVPTTLPLGLARACVAAALGLGAGVAAGAALHLRATADRTRRAVVVPTTVAGDRRVSDAPVTAGPTRIEPGD